MSANSFTAVGAAPAGAGGAPAQLIHAKLIVHEPGAGTTATPGAPRGEIEFQFNPRELTMAKSAKWKRDTQRNAKKSGVPEFTGAEPSKLTLEMFLDATEKMDDKVVKTVEQLFECCVPTAQSLKQKKSSPPWVIFRWGGLTGFPAYISSVSAKYTLFTPTGTPVRAVCTVTLEEIAGEPGGQNPTSGTLAPQDTHVLVEGESLQSVAFGHYGDASLWRAIAETNGIDDPMRLAAGTTLMIPDLAEVRHHG